MVATYVSCAKIPKPEALRWDRLNGCQEHDETVVLYEFNNLQHISVKRTAN